MPNWCSNNVTFSHSSKKQIQRLVKAFQGDGLMQEFYPCPKELKETRAGSYAKDAPEYERHIQQQEDNKAKYGHTDWYDWQVANWGTKWDVRGQYPIQTDLSPCGQTVTLSFESAWSPPIAFYNHMLSLGFSVAAYYYESGVSFCGKWEDGKDDFYDISGDSDWVYKHIPHDIDDAMAISESMATWEEEEEGEGEEDEHDKAADS
jgi:hypothetical protein